MSFTSHPAAGASRWRDVYLAAAARAVSSAGIFMATTALVLTLQPISGFAVAAVVLASTVPTVVLAPLAGRIADRVDSRTVLTAAGTAQVLAALALALGSGPAHLVTFMALLGAGTAITNPVFGALTPAMVDRPDLPRASAVMQTASMVGMLTGPALAGLLVGAYGLRLPLLINAMCLTAVVGAGLLLRTRRGGSAGATPPDTAPADPTPASATPPDTAPADPTPAGATPAGPAEPTPAGASPAGPVPAGAAPATSAAPRWSLWHDPMLRAMALLLGAVVGAVGALNVVDVFLVRDTLDASPATYGLLETTWTVGVLLGAWLLARAASRAHDDGALMHGLLLTLAGLCAVLPLAALVPAAAWLVPLWIVGGACNGGLNVFGNVLVAHRTPERSRGSAYATLGATIHGAGMVGYAGGGVLVEWVPTRPLVAALGGAGLLVVGSLTPAVLRTVRRERHQPTVAGHPEQPVPTTPAG